MKFGEQLRASIIREYEYYYIDYEGLKAQLKQTHDAAPIGEGPSTSDNTVQWSADDEEAFIRSLEGELDKVHTKQKVKAIEIQRRIASAEQEVNDVVSRMINRGPITANGQSEDGPTEEDFELLEQELSDVIADVHDLAKFVQLNYTGFQKIIKKHDKQTRWKLKPVFATQLKARPFFKANYDADIVKLSKLYDIVRTRGNPVKGDSAAGGAQGSFIRQTTKYWVHPDNITELKLIILKHLPVLVFNASKEFEAKDSAITSIYYDNPETWDLYAGRLKKTEGAEAIRLRWYGGMDTEQIFVERKTHREDWTGEKSVKARFSIKEKNVNVFMKGELLPQALFEKARKEGKKPEKQIAEDERLAREVQYSVIKHGYKPVCRSFYNRTAFQLPGDARVRISLDTELTMVREDNLDGRTRSGDNWRRMDIGIDYPFSQLPPEDVERFPYAVLEVKLQTQYGQEPPEWVRQLISSHLVEAVPKFSKFIHGTATLFPDRIKLLPFWMPQMDVDIRKPKSHDFGIQRHDIANSTTSDDDDDDFDSEDDEESTQTERHSGEQRNGRNGTTATAEGNGQTAAPNTLDVEEQFAAQPLNEPYPVYESDDEDTENDAIEEARRAGSWGSYYSMLVARELRRTGDQISKIVRKVPLRPAERSIPRSNGLTSNFGTGVIESKRFKAPKGKKIHVPVRVEPKVYFAAERTFLSWLEFSIYIGTISATLLNFGSKPTLVSFVASGAFSLVALLALLYSIAIYLYRSQAIRGRKAIKYHDKYGATVLCGVLFIAVVLNFAFEIKDRL